MSSFSERHFGSTADACMGAPDLPPTSSPTGALDTAAAAAAPALHERSEPAKLNFQPRTISNPLVAEASALAAFSALAPVGRRPASNPVEHAIAEALNWRSPSLLVAGAELGLWMVLAFGLEVAGVEVSGRGERRGPGRGEGGGAESEVVGAKAREVSERSRERLAHPPPSPNPSP